jgi:methionyl-tRNA formyltransferase
MIMKRKRVAFVGKDGDPHCAVAADFLRQHSTDPLICFGKRGDPLPPALETWHGDLLISYLSPWIIPAAILERAENAALNFHPAPPQYPGIGCTNFAIYDGAREYGVTCHHMNPKVDTGAIVAVRRFEVLPGDTVYSITQRCYTSMLPLFYEVMTQWLRGGTLPTRTESWGREPYRRSELNALCRVTACMDKDEIRRRVKATSYPGAPGAYVELAGIRFAAPETATEEKAAL